MLLKLFISQFLLLSIINTVYSRCDGEILEVSFLSGIRMTDGHGDLTLNRSVIDAQVHKLQAKYKDCIKINIVYFGEALETDNYSIIKNVFDGQIYNDATDNMFSADGRVVLGNYHDKKLNISHFTKEEYIKQYSRPGKSVDLQIMVSDVSNTTSDEVDEPFRLKDDIKKLGNTITFLEYKDYPESIENFTTHSVRDKSSIFLEAKINAGIGSNGLYLDDNSESDINIRDFIKKGTQNGQYFKPIKKNSSTRNGENRINVNNSIFNDPKAIIVPSYLSPASNDIEESKKSSIRTVLQAFEDYQQKQIRFPLESPKYIIYSNMFKHITYEEIIYEFKKNNPTIHETFGFDSRSEVDEFMNKKLDSFKFFLRNNAALLQSGDEYIPSEIYKVLFKNSKFTQVGGYGSIADALNEGSLPVIHSRLYHYSHTQKYVNHIQKKAKEYYKDQINKNLDLNQVINDNSYFNLNKSAGFFNYYNQTNSFNQTSSFIPVLPIPLAQENLNLSQTQIINTISAIEENDLPTTLVYNDRIKNLTNDDLLKLHKENMIKMKYDPDDIKDGIDDFTKKLKKIRFVSVNQSQLDDKNLIALYNAPNSLHGKINDPMKIVPKKLDASLSNLCNLWKAGNIFKNQEEFVYLYNKTKDMQAYVAQDIKNNHNANNYIRNIIDDFYLSKQSNPENVSSEILEKSFFGKYDQNQSNFLSQMEHYMFSGKNNPSSAYIYKCYERTLKKVLAK